MAGQSLSHKILARASGRSRVETGDVVIARVDRAMTYDPFAGLLHRRFVERWGAHARIWDPERLVLIADHFLDPAQPRHMKLQEELDAFARAYGVRHYYPVGAANHGVCHAVLPEEGLVRPGELIVGTDSHSCHYGGFGAIGLGIGVDAMEGVLALGQYWIEVPPQVRIEIGGRFPDGVYAKDVILRLCGELANEKGLLGTAVELDGTAVQALHPEEKLTLANMAAELGARWLVVPPDEAVCAYVRAHGGGEDFEALLPDADAQYAAVYRYDGASFEPAVALPGAPDRVVPVSALPAVAFNEVFVGSCTGAKQFDLQVLAHRLGNGGLARGVMLDIVPATRRTKEWLFAEPDRAARFRQPGIRIAETPGCNACCGSMGFMAGPQSVRLSTTNRNFPGRMGAREAQVYLGSPAIAAEVAATGRLGR